MIAITLTAGDDFLNVDWRADSTAKGIGNGISLIILQVSFPVCPMGFILCSSI